MGKFPSRVKIGGKVFHISYVDEIPDKPEAGSWLAVETSRIYIARTASPSVLKRYLLLRLVDGIIRLVSADAGLLRQEHALGNAIFGIVAMNRGLSSVNYADDIKEVCIPGHTLNVVQGTVNEENEGELDMPCLEIRVHALAKGFDRFETIWHEVVHLAGCLIDRDYKEWQVCYLGFCLASMFAQNDFSWLYDDTD